MTTRTRQLEKEVVYYCTFTCYKWIPLFEITDFYDAVYKWFDILKKFNNKVLVYVIMPNHIHVLIYVDNNSPIINKLVANGKRFMAYEIVKRLKQMKYLKLLQQLEVAVSEYDKKRGKLHEVFQDSFDCKPCYSKKFIEQKIDYIHHNPCAKKWNLAEEYVKYPHSSAMFYETDVHGAYIVYDYRLLDW